MKTSNHLIIMIFISWVLSSFNFKASQSIKIIVENKIVTDTLRFRIKNLSKDTTSFTIALQAFFENRWGDVYSNIYDFNRNSDSLINIKPKVIENFNVLTSRFSQDHLKRFQNCKFRLQVVVHHRKSPFEVSYFNSSTFKFLFKN